LYSTSGCKRLTADKLYALKLEHAPEEEDWNNALTFFVTARNGNLHELHKSVDVDKDTVHTSSQSCHHQRPEAPPVRISLKAYYTDEEIFLRVAWSDQTRDDRMFEYYYADSKWNVSNKLEDGLGIMWDMSEGHSPFNCSIACHTTDWSLKDYNLISKFKMGTKGDDEADLWNWKAFRTNTYNFADDKFINTKGIIPDTPSKIYFYNSENKRNLPLSGSARNITPLKDGDTPENDLNGLPIKDGYWMLKGTAPGVRVTMPTGNRGDVKAKGVYKDNGWEVTFRRKLITEDSKDVTFVVKRTNIYKFGIAVMDNTITNHYAVKEPVSIKFVAGLRGFLKK
jgi:hypothetical protein